MPKPTDLGKFIDALRECIDLEPLYKGKSVRPELDRFYTREYTPEHEGLPRRRN